jgi:hypothetical protein
VAVDRIDHHEVLLSDLRVSVARIEETQKAVLDRLAAAAEDRDAMRRSLAEKLDPLHETVIRWKGAMSVLAVAAGAFGAFASDIIKRLLGFDT